MNLPLLNKAAKIQKSCCVTHFRSDNLFFVFFGGARIVLHEQMTVGIGFVLNINAIAPKRVELLLNISILVVFIKEMSPLLLNSTIKSIMEVSATNN